VLKTNLSTRPFYNERGIHMAVALVALVVIAFTVWNVARLVTLTSRRSTLSSASAADEQAAADLRARADALERSVDAVALGVVAAEAREASGIVDGRAFSWTAFFNRLEETLPPGVMLASVAPSVDRGEVTVSMVVVARRAEDVDDFMERLEASGAFAGVLNVNDTVGEDGLHRASLRGRYLGAAAPEAAQ
jgi:Tfp pilus assembly protein PilX